MRLFKRGSFYWFEFVYDGARYQRSTRVKNRNIAADIASAFRTSLAKGDVGITDRKRVPGFKTACKDFLDWSEQEHRAHPGPADRYRYSSLALLRYFRDAPLDRITPDEVERYKTSRAAEYKTVRGKDNKRIQTKQRLRPATVNRELACLKALFNHAIKADHLLRNPVSNVRFLDENNQQERVLSYSEQRRYLAKASPILQDVASLIIETGMRPEEIYTLQAVNVDLDRGFLRITQGKTPAARRRIDLTPTVFAILQRRLEATELEKTHYLFPCQSDIARPLPGIQSAHRRALQESKVTGFRPYDLRHTWATRPAEAGIDLVTLAAMLGFSRIQMVMRYAHPTQGHQSSAMEKLIQHNTKQEEIERASEMRKAAELR
jgi:integrase